MNCKECGLPITQAYPAAPYNKDSHPFATCIELLKAALSEATTPTISGLVGHEAGQDDASALIAALKAGQEESDSRIKELEEENDRLGSSLIDVSTTSMELVSEYRKKHELGIRLIGMIEAKVAKLSELTDPRQFGVASHPKPLCHYLHWFAGQERWFPMVWPPTYFVDHRDRWLPMPPAPEDVP